MAGGSEQALSSAATVAIIFACTACAFMAVLFFVLRVRKSRLAKRESEPNLLLSSFFIRQPPPSYKSFVDHATSPIKTEHEPVIVVSDYSDETKSDDSLESPQRDEKEKEFFEVTVGHLSFTVGYDKANEALVVKISRAFQLAFPTSSDTGSGQFDPYIKLQILPEKRHSVKTRVLRNTRDPVYDETFTFYDIPASQLDEISLHFVVLIYDRYSRDKIFGDVLYPLRGVNLFESEVTLKKPIIGRDLVKNQLLGDLLVSLCYQPASNRLSVVILKAKQLPTFATGSPIDPYIKVYLSVNGQRVAKKRTRVKKETVNPVFNESFVFEVPSNELDLASVELFVLDWKSATKNEVIGKVEIGANSGAQGDNTHWQEIQSQPRKQIAKWYALQPVKST